MNEKILHRFKKDYRLPIPVINNEKIFQKYLDLYDARYNANAKWREMQDLIKECGNEELFLEQYAVYKDSIIQYISKQLEDSGFSSFDLKTEFPQDPKGYSSSSIYNHNNHGQLFLSIDLRQANFSVLKLAGFLKDNSWEDLVKTTCPSASERMQKYLIESKYTRQVVFGQCNPKRHIALERHFIWKIRQKFEELGLGDNYELVCQNNDEIVYRVFEHVFPPDFIEEYLSDFPVHVKEFTIYEAVLSNRSKNRKKICTGFLVRKWQKGYWHFQDETWKCVPEHFAGIFEWSRIKSVETGNSVLTIFPKEFRVVNFEGLEAELTDNLELQFIF